MKKLLRLGGFLFVCANYTIFMPRKGFFKKLLWLEKWFRKFPLGGQYYVVGEKK